MSDNKANTSQNMLNRRYDLRYQVRDISIGEIGVITDISRGGVRIKKNTEEEISVDEIVLSLTKDGIRTVIVWQTDQYLGLRFVDKLNDLRSAARHIRFLHETTVDPHLGMMEKKLIAEQDDSALHSLIELLVELDMPMVDINKLKSIIHQESGLDEAKTKEDDRKHDDRWTMQDEILKKIAGPDDAPTSMDINLDHAIDLLGIDTVKEVLKKYLKKQLIRAHSSMQNYVVFNILEAVVLHHLSNYFGYSDKDGEAKAMLSHETVGLERLVKNSTGLLSTYYSGPGPFYSEISRRYERLLFGTDMISVNYRFFHKDKESFTELYSGYVIAYQTLNPFYALSDSVKLSLTSNNLRFSSIASLLFLFINAIIGKDKKSGCALVKRLKGRGMQDRKMANIIDEIIAETNHILTEYEIPGKLGRASLPSSFEKVEKSFPKEIHFSYLFDAFREMDSKTTHRMAIRYQDQTFTHFVLNKILNGADFELSSRNLCVIPCNNLLEDPVYYDDLLAFELLILKDVDMLPQVHFSLFEKLWNSFEGDIIVTFNTNQFIDFTNDRLYQTIREYIVDFPSYYASDTIYQAMLKQTVEYMQRAVEQEIDTNKYHDDIYTMNEIKADILQKWLPGKKAEGNPSFS